MAAGFTAQSRLLRKEAVAAGDDPAPAGLQIPLAWRLSVIALLGILAAAGVAYLTSRNPNAAPAHLSVELRVVIILTLVAAGIYAQTSRVQARMGPLLVATGLYSAVWLLNGSSSRVPFSLGSVAAVLSPTVFYSLMLSHPDGHLHSRAERRLVIGAGSVFLLAGTLLVLTSRQPPLRTALWRCTPHCPENALFVGSISGGAASVLKAAIWVAWTALALVTPVLITRRARSTTGRLRRVLTPVEVVGVLSAVAWIGFVVGGMEGAHEGHVVGDAYIAVAATIPIAILTGLVLERSSVGPGLASLVAQLALSPDDDPEEVMRSALQDPSLDIAYYAAGVRTWVDSSGIGLQLPTDDADRAITQINDDRTPVAAVIYDATMADQDPYIRAAAAAAIMHLQRNQLDADLKASTKALAASRLRVLDASTAERQRIERDLHDGIQQHLVATRLRLEIAADVIKAEPERGQRLLASVGRQMDDVIGTLRSIARGIYPSLLSEHGLVDALRSAAQQSPLPASLSARDVGRYPEEIEVAVYFACLEALQNAVKHAGADAAVGIRLWEEPGLLCFEVRDDGVGFDEGAISDRHGLLNMRDRTEAVGGELTIDSQPGHGTTVHGTIPVGYLRSV